MNQFLRILICLWLVGVALFIHLVLGLSGFALAFTDYHFMYSVTPWMGLTCIICIILAGRRVWKSNPWDYIKAQVTLVKAKIQR